MSKITIDLQVKGSLGVGKIVRIITPSTGYVEVNYNGVLKKEMAFNLTDMEGNLLKSKPKSETAGMSKGQKKRHKDRKALEAHAALPNLKKIQNAITAINGIVQGDRNSLHYQLISELLAGIFLKAKELDNQFIIGVINSIEKYMKASEKQAAVVAKFADDNGIKYEDK